MAAMATPLLPLSILQSRNRDLFLGKEVTSRKQQKENTKQKTEQREGSRKRDRGTNGGARAKQNGHCSEALSAPQTMRSLVVKAVAL